MKRKKWKEKDFLKKTNFTSKKRDPKKTGLF